MFNMEKSRFRLKYREVLNRTIGLKSSPKMFKELILQFEDMSKGNSGGVFFLGHRQSTVRDQYYSHWSDEDFTRLLRDLKEHIDEK